MFAVRLGKMMENTKKYETRAKSKYHEGRRTQKGIWKFHPQGVKRPVKIKRCYRRRNKGKTDNFWERSSNRGGRAAKVRRCSRRRNKRKTDKFWARSCNEGDRPVKVRRYSRRRSIRRHYRRRNKGKHITVGKYHLIEVVYLLTSPLIFHSGYQNAIGNLS